MSLAARSILAALTFGALGCSYHGSGTALLRTPATATAPVKVEGKIAFRWQSKGDTSRGTIQAALPDGRQFSGTYVQPTTTQWLDSYSPYMNSWSSPWGPYRPWYGGPRSNFAVQYGGKALAHLEASDGARMRCEFSLYSPGSGLSGGGQGECQLSTNEEAFDAVLQRDD